MFVTLRKVGAALGLTAARADGAVSLSDTLTPNWSNLPLNVDNLNANVRTLGRTGHEQTVRTGVFAMEGPNAPVLRISQIVEELLGHEINSTPTGPQFRRVTEPTLHAEMVGADGARKTFAFHATTVPNVFRHSTHDGAKMKPFMAGVEPGRGSVKLKVDENGYPVSLTVHTGGQETAPRARFTGYGAFREPPPADSFT